MITPADMADAVNLEMDAYNDVMDYLRNALTVEQMTDVLVLMNRHQCAVVRRMQIMARGTVHA